MTPSRLSFALRRIAARIEASSAPVRALVVRDLRHVVSKLRQPIHHSSGDPEQEGGYDFTSKVLFDHGDQVVVSVSGTVGGVEVSGELTVHLDDNREFNGYDYSPDEGTVNIAEDPEGLLQVVLDAVDEDIADLEMP